MNISSREKLADVISRTKFSSLRWTTDNRGIFYTTYADAPEKTESTSNDPVKQIDSIKITSLHFRQQMSFHRQRSKLNERIFKKFISIVLVHLVHLMFVLLDVLKNLTDNFSLWKLPMMDNI